MGKRDKTGRLFFSDEEVFAELMNLHIYGGKQVVKETNLKILSRSYPLYGTGGADKERDVIMRDERSRIRYGLELQDKSDFTMTERVRMYDACEYEEQIRTLAKIHKKRKKDGILPEDRNRIHVNDRIDPVVTMVLYLGEGKWKGRDHLSELFGIDDELKELLGPVMPEEYIRIVEADYVDPKQYSTELHAFFKAMQCRGNKQALDEVMEEDEFHQLSWEAQEAISAYLNIPELWKKVKKEGIEMCQAYQELKEDWKNEGMEKGIKEGKRKGKREERTAIIQRMIKKGLDEDQIINLIECTKAEYARAVKLGKR